MDVAAELQDPGFLRMLSGFKKGTVVEPALSESDTDEAEDPDVLAPAKRRRKEKPILLKDIPRDAVSTKQVCRCFSTPPSALKTVPQSFWLVV